MTEKMAGPSFLYYINFSVDLYDFSIKAYPVLLPLFGNLYNICLSIKSLISLSTVTCEHFPIFAHLELVSLPSNPSNNLFNIFFCLSFSILEVLLVQNLCLKITFFNIFLDNFKAFNKQYKNHCNHSVISSSPVFTAFYAVNIIAILRNLYLNCIYTFSLCANISVAFFNKYLSRQRTGSKYNFRGFPGSSKRRKQADIKLWRKERKVAIG